MRLGDLTDRMRNVDIAGMENPAIVGITSDSREVRTGFLFAAIPGTRDDGNRFVDDAIEKGAVALLLADIPRPEPRIPFVVCKNIRLAYGEAVDAFYDHPSGALDLIGVTGTNGKTTSAYVLRHIFNAAARKAGMLGTIEYDLGERVEPSPLTTPDAAVFTKSLAEMRDFGCTTAVVEVSSHALAQDRTWPHRFSGAIFTNLTRDHLDYHGSMDAYLEAKRRLFARLDRDAVAVVNFRDPAAPALLEGCAARVYGFMLEDRDVDKAGPAVATPARLVHARITESDLSGQSFTVRMDGATEEYRIPLVGRHNVENCLGCVVMALGQGVRAHTIQEALADFPGVPGRLERIESRDGERTAFVDYAHTDDALRSVLSVLKPLVKGRLITVFGCGGDRDAGKRPLMAKAAEAFSDVVVVTSDNPRTENPDHVINDIMPGFADPGTVVREADRPLAIRAAVRMAEAGDVILVAGKGHEDYQIVGTEKRHMDDRELVREAFAESERKRI